MSVLILKEIIRQKERACDSDGIMTPSQYQVAKSFTFLPSKYNVLYNMPYVEVSEELIQAFQKDPIKIIVQDGSNMISRILQNKLDFWLSSLCDFVVEHQIQFEMSYLDYTNILKASQSKLASILEL